MALIFCFLNAYGSLTKDFGLSDPKVNVPALLIMGEKDYVLKFPGMEDYIRSGVVKHFVPDMDITYIPEGSHFVHEQVPEKVNQLIIEFLHKQSVRLFLLLLHGRCDRFLCC
ncbi:hypothetical protein PIB30_028180 [Stylosanthes scabra]|uniref:Uncharacterized protein n=1 Tax=Stylosanthes scabra TaxID=79078 RepID=A0ABU6QB91_9FABA|nr:hypothetical protein [Stylosanthes scabra]